MPATEECPESYPALVAFDDYPGLDIACSCSPDSKFESEYGTECTGDLFSTRDCETKPAIPTLYLGVIENYKVCGKRGGEPFKTAIRPVSNGSDILRCPEGTVPCDDSFKPVDKNTVFRQS